MQREMERVFVTGMGVSSPLGMSVADFWTGLLEGRSGIVGLEPELYGDLRTRIGGLISSYEPEDRFTSREVRRMSRSSQLALLAAEQAIRQADIDNRSVDYSGVAVIIGSSIGGFSASDPSFKSFYAEGRMSTFTIPVSMNVGPASNVSIRYGFGGPLMTVDAACASSAHSIGYAYNLIRTGMLEVAVAGGADSPFSPAVVGAWCVLHALSERNDDPGHACRPFSADRDGLVLGEGAGILVLESERSAERRGAVPLAEITGYGATGDSYHLTQPTLEGPVRAMQNAIQDARLSPEKIDYINAHGTGTESNDRNETAAIKEVFGERAYVIPVVSTKAALGHSVGASAALELISCILSIRDQIVPPTINCRVPDPECDLDYVTTGCRTHEIHAALSNSFAFGGSNAVLVISRPDAK
jgi:beta-ketoacyl-acyl-carrier-protein synthase II